MDFLENSLSEDYKILHAYWAPIVSINLPDITSLALSSRLQNSIKYYTKVRKTDPAGIKKSRIIQSRFEARSPVMTRLI